MKNKDKLEHVVNKTINELEKIGHVGGGLYHIGGGCYSGKKGWEQFSEEVKKIANKTWKL